MSTARLYSHNTPAGIRRPSLSAWEAYVGFLRQEGNHVVQTMFGGSVKKGTYVTGLSDVDVLLIVNESSLVNQSPSAVIAYVQDTIQRWLPNNTVTAGKLAVTVNYAKGSEIQLLPANPNQDRRRSDCGARKHPVEQRGASREIR